MRIVYSTNSVTHVGGIERVTIAKANALSLIAGNEVWIVVTDNSGKNPVLPINPLVKVIDLHVHYFHNDKPGIMYAIKDAFTKRRVHAKRMEKLLNDIRPDVVIATGTSEKYFLPFIKVNSNPIFIREIHFVKNYRVAHAANVKDKLVSRFVDFFDYELMIKKYDKVVVLTEKDRVENWHCRKDVVVMPNPLTQVPECKSNGDLKKVVAVGRLTSAKNFSSLLRTWGIVAQKHPDWTLNIWGDGNMKESLDHDINQLGLRDKVCLKGYTSSPLKAMCEGSIYVLSSSFEGFPLVIIEAMSVGLPVVAYDCPYGPQDIITEGKDGFLVKLNNEDLLAEKICVLIEDNEKRLWMSSNAQQKAAMYEVGVIAEKWMKLFVEISQGNNRNK